MRKEVRFFGVLLVAVTLGLLAMTVSSVLADNPNPVGVPAEVSVGSSQPVGVPAKVSVESAQPVGMPAPTIMQLPHDSSEIPQGSPASRPSYSEGSAAIPEGQPVTAP